MAIHARVIHWAYTRLAKPIFFRLDPEWVHDHVVRVGVWLGNAGWTKRVTRFVFSFEHPALVQDVLGIRFSNPVGLTAGFDKNAQLTRVVGDVGFGFAEIGSVTGEPCAGNPKPRLWRLPKSKALVVWYGLKNDGCEAVAGRLSRETFSLPVGTSVARTNDESTVGVQAGIADYAKAFRAFASIGAYTAVNISCPNTCGGEPFTDPERLEMLLSELDRIETSKPTFLKLSVDLSLEEIDAIVRVCDRHCVQGFIVSNLTKRYERDAIDAAERANIERGGVSGRPTFGPSNMRIAHLYRTVGSRYCIIGSGGIFSAQDAYEKIRLGASLVQLATGMIYEGPQLIGEINRGLVRLLKRDGFSTISQAVGSAHHTQAV